jgi:hypothetical protein
MKKVLLAVLAASVFAGVAVAAVTQTITIRNDSNWTIHYLYLSPTSETDWGPDQLGDNVINTGETFTLNGIPCKDDAGTKITYDVKIVDEDSDECIIGAVDLCEGDDTWVITTSDLLECQAATRTGGE